MTLKNKELEISLENRFSNCKLDREKYAKTLTTIIENYPEGFVLAINNKWGTGKTTFVKMWEQHLKNSNFKTIYFNAWENDFEDHPLTAFVGELQVINKKEKDKFNNIVKNAGLISKNVAPAVLKAVINKYIDSDTLTEAISNTSKSFIEIFEEDIKEYSKRKESITNFKKSLSEFVANESNGKPLIFIVDELDRCRPNYAVLLLEQIKHFFSVPNIVFILSIDKTQLGNAICGVYGSEKIDSDEYLRRFIDLEYSIPEPQKETFFKHLYDYLEFDIFFKATKRNNYPDFRYERDDFIIACKTIIGSLTLRQQEKTLSLTRLALRSFNHNNFLLPTLFVFLSYIKINYPDFYLILSNKTLPLKEVQEEYYKLIKSFIIDDTRHLFVRIEAHLLKLYENQKPDHKWNSNLLEKIQENGKYILKIESMIDNDLLFTELTNHGIMYNYSEMPLSYILNKLDLIDGIKIN